MISGNIKRNRDHYIDHLPKTLDLLKNKKVIFFYDDDEILEIVKASIDTEYFVARKLLVSEMWAQQYIDQIVACSKKFKILSWARVKAEKGVVHYRRDLLGSGEEAYKSILTIWLSRIFIVTDIVIEENPFDTPNFAWVDASISRLRKSSAARIVDKTVVPDKVLMNGSRMRYQGRRLNYSGGFILASLEDWKNFRGLFSRELLDSIQDTYPFDDEVLIHKISKKHGHLFQRTWRHKTLTKKLRQRFRDIFLNSYYSTAYLFFISISKFKR